MHACSCCMCGSAVMLHYDSATGQRSGNDAEQRAADRLECANSDGPVAILLQLHRHVDVHRSPVGE
jgi:hypothetical protein